MFIFLKTMFFCFKKMRFYFKKCFFKKNRFHVCYWLKKNKKKHTKGSRNQIGCAKYTVGRNRKYVFFGALVCSQITTGIYCWDHFKRSNPKYRFLFFVSVFHLKKNEGYCCLVFRQTCSTNHGLCLIECCVFPK